MQDIFTQYQEFLQQDDLDYQVYREAEAERIERCRQEELEEIEQWSETKVCQQYNVNNKQEAREIIQDYYQLYQR